MSSSAAASTIDSITKAEFARRRKVTPGRVSQWISEGKISGPALDGEGRSALIREAIACEQLRRKLDPIQMTANGIGTTLAPSASRDVAEVLPFAHPAPAPAVHSNEPQPDSVEEKIKRSRLEQLERQNREGKRQEAINAGRLTDAGMARAATARETARLVTVFEGSLSDLATAISAEFKLAQRDVLHLLRTKFRDLRANLASDARNRAETMPPFADVNLGDDGSDVD